MDLNKEEQIYSYSPQVQRRNRIWAIGGGKGGVGKSLVTANTSICLALMGHKVITIDLDLGGANIHTCLGLPIPGRTLSDFISGRLSSIADAAVDTPFDNLKVISGAQDELGITNLKQMDKTKILHAISQLDADYVLLDLGAGTSFHTLDFFLAADKGILVVLPEPTSIENTYRFIRSAFYRKLTHSRELGELHDFVESTLNAKMGKASMTPKDLLLKIETMDPQLGSRLVEDFAKFAPQLIMNQVRNQQDIDLGYSIRNISKKYFGLNLTYAGYLDYDPAVWQSVKKKKPLLMEYPYSPLVNNFEYTVKNLLRQ